MAVESKVSSAETGNTLEQQKAKAEVRGKAAI